MIIAKFHRSVTWKRTCIIQRVCPSCHDRHQHGRSTDCPRDWSYWYVERFSYAIEQRSLTDILADGIGKYVAINISNPNHCMSADRTLLPDTEPSAKPRRQRKKSSSKTKNEKHTSRPAKLAKQHRTESVRMRSMQRMASRDRRPCIQLYVAGQ